jgi:hypothetical protein
MNYKIEITCLELIAILSRKALGRTEENWENPHSGQPVSRQRFDPNT